MTPEKPTDGPLPGVMPGRTPENAPQPADFVPRDCAKGLLRTIIADAAARGRDRVGLEVDADSPTGASGLYQSMGWKTKYATQSWHKDVSV